MALPLTIKIRPKYSQALTMESHLQFILSFPLYRQGNRGTENGSGLVAFLQSNHASSRREVSVPWLESMWQRLYIIFLGIEIALN